MIYAYNAARAAFYYTFIYSALVYPQKIDIMFESTRCTKHPKGE